MTNLSLRQQKIVDATKNFEVTCDVGCDHGYIGVELLKNNKTKFLIASDISEKSVKKAENLLKKENLLEFASIKVCDGLSSIDKNVDQIIIAGMGGKEIVHILSEYKNIKNTKYFAFQPMNELVFFRKFLEKINLKIIKDFIVYDKKFYHIITAKNGDFKLTDFQSKWGYKPKQRNSDYFLWLDKKEEKIKNIVTKLPKYNEKSEKFLKCLSEIKKIKKTKGARKC
ncbi:MAG: SAM-dependent methyltransferase [Clostridia bacterium]|nr:SAM-dependent methyltransferase [Clostridia bacterium]